MTVIPAPVVRESWSEIFEACELTALQLCWELLAFVLLSAAGGGLTCFML
jgi:hypothetical protein